MARKRKPVPRKRSLKEQYPDGFDNLDLRLLDALQTDVAVPVAELAQRLHSSKSVIWRRLQRYLDEGIITARVALLDPHKLGLRVMVWAHVKMNRHGADALASFVDAVRNFPQVIECHTLMGNVDFLLKIVVRDVDEYEDFLWHKLSRVGDVREINSSISLSKFVNTTRLPLNAR